MNKGIKSPLKHKKGDALAHGMRDIAGEADWHAKNPDIETTTVEEKEKEKEITYDKSPTIDKPEPAKIEKEKSSFSLGEMYAKGSVMSTGDLLTADQAQEVEEKEITFDKVDGKTTSEFLKEIKPQGKTKWKYHVKSLPKITKDIDGNWLVDGEKPDSSEDRLNSAMKPYIESKEYNSEELAKIRERLSVAIEDGENISEISPAEPMTTLTSAVSTLGRTVETPVGTPPLTPSEIVKRKQLIPSADEIEDMIGGSVFFIEKNFVKNFNKKLRDLGNTRYEIEEAIPGLDYFRILDKQTSTYSDAIHLGSGDALDKHNRIFWENASESINEFITSGESNKRVKEDVVLAQERFVHQQLTNKNFMIELLGSNATTYLDPNVIDHTNMLNSIIDYKQDDSMWSETLLDEISSYFMKQNPLVDETQLQNIVKHELEKLSSIQVQNEEEVQYTSDIESGLYNEKQANKLYNSWFKTKLLHASSEERSLALAVKELNNARAKYEKKLDEEGMSPDYSSHTPKHIQELENKVARLRSEWGGDINKPWFGLFGDDTEIKGLINWNDGSSFHPGVNDKFYEEEDGTIGGVEVTEEELNLLSETQKTKILLEAKKSGMTYHEALKFYQMENIRDQNYLRKQGKKIERVVINNPYVEKWLASRGIYPVDHGKLTGIGELQKDGTVSFDPGMSTANGLVYDLEVDFIAQHSGRLIRDDGNSWGSPSSEYRSPLGYFGLLSRDKDQDFTWVERKLQDTDDPRESLNSYLSSDFVNYIDKYREDKSNYLKMDNVLFHMVSMDVDLGSLNKTTAAQVASWAKHMGEVTVEGFGNAFVQSGIGEEQVDVAYGNREMINTLDLVAQEYDIPLSESQEDAIKTSEIYKFTEGVANFTPAIVEFALIDIALKKTGVITGVPRLIENMTVGYRTAKGAGISTARMRVLERTYRAKNGLKATDKVRGTQGFHTFMATRTGANGEKLYKVGRGYNTWGNVGKHTYYAIREEFKMKMAFDEDYKMGGGVAFYGIGQMMNKMIPLTKLNRWNTVIKLGRGGAAGALSVQGAHNLEALIEDLKGNKTFMNAFNHHYGDEEWLLNMAIDGAVFGAIGVKSIANKASFKSTRNLQNGNAKLKKRLYGQDGPYKNLPRTYDPQTGKMEVDWSAARKSNFKSKEARDIHENRINELEGKYNSQKDLLKATEKQLAEMSLIDNWKNNPEYAKAHLESIGGNAVSIMNKISPKGEGKWEFETTNDKLEKSDKGKIKDKDAAASFDFARKKIIINTDHASPGKLPHEVVHFVFKELFKQNPEAATRFKMAIKDAFPGKFFMGVKVRDKSGKETGEVKDMTIEEFIQNEYGKSSESIKAEEYVAYVSEILADPNMYGNLVYNKKSGTMRIGKTGFIGDNVFTRIRDGINRFSNEVQGKDVSVFSERTSKQEIITFLANFSKSVKSGTATEKQLRMFKKFNLPEGPLLEDVRADSRKEGDIILTEMNNEMSSKKLNESKRKSQETQDIYDNIYKKAKTEQEKDKVISDYFIGGRNAKKGTELYEYEIRRQNKGKSEEQIQKLIEKGPPRLQVKGQFDDIVGDAISKLYPDLTYAERQSFFKDIMVDPFKSEKAQARGVSGLIKKYRPEEGQNLTQMVREHLVGGGKAGFSRLHEIKGRASGEVFEGFRKSIGTETGEIRESELGFTKQKEFDAKAKVTKRGKLDIVENLKLENNIEDINRKAGDVIEKSKLQEMTTRKIGENMLDVTRPLVEGIFGRTPEFYKEMKSGAKGKSAEYKQVIANTRNVLFDNAKIFHAAIQKQISEMTGEVSGSMKKFADLFEPTGKRMQFGEMPSWMDLTASQKARGPFMFIKKQFNKSELDGKRAFLDFMYSNPKTGKKLTNAQVNTRVENLIDQVAISMGAQRAARLIDQPGYKDMVLSKEGMGKMFDRQVENLRFLNQEVQLNKVREQIRDTLDNQLSSKKNALAVSRDGVAVENRFIYLAKSGLKSEEIVDILEIEYPWVVDIRKDLLNIDLKDLSVMDVMKAFSKGERTFGENWMEEMKVGPGGVELFPGGVVSKKQYSLNEAIIREALEIGLNKDLLDLRSASMKFKGEGGAKIAKDYYLDFLPRVAKKLGLEVLELNAFQKMIGEGTLEPNIFGKWQYRLEKYQTKNGKVVLTKTGKPKKGKWYKVDNEKDIPNNAIERKLAQLNAKTAKELIEKYKKTTKKLDIDLSHVRIKDNSTFLREWNDFVTKVEAEGLKGKKLEKAIKEWSNKKLAAKGDYAATKKANKDLLEHISLALNKVCNDLIKEGKGEFAINNLHLLYQSQTNIGLGPFRGLATHKSGTLEKAKEIEFDAEGKLMGDWKDFYRSEHFFQNVNLVGNNLVGTIKYHNNNAEFLKIHRTVSNMFGQAGITKRHQVVVDANGNTVNIIEKEGLGTRSLGEFNIFNDRIALEKTIDFESGKMFSEIMYPTVSKVLVLNNLRKFIKSKGLDIKGKTNSELVASSKKIDQAIANGRKAKKERKGMSTWDFDDTLAITKSGVRARIPSTDGKPKPNRKVVFLAGGAGSGKSNVVKKLGLEKQGFKIVNQDISLEWLKKNNGLPENMNDLTKEQRSTLGKLQHEARAIAKRKMMKYQGKADGVVIDGTGGSMKAMEGLVKEFKDKGYDVSMLFVETSLKTALERNKARKERSLLDKIVEKNHEAVQGNKDGFKEMFGERFMEVKTDDLRQEDAMPVDLVSKMNDFVRSYEKIRLDAEQFATEGKSILDKGGKFDFSEFNVVTEGVKGPFFQKALERAKKFGTEHQYVLTARPPEAQIPIHEFLKSQGLNIPLKNIKGLGNSTGEAKAMWMLEKFAEGYNDMYFADDALQNVEAVRDVLKQVGVKSKVERAISIERIKDIDKLDSPDISNDVRSSKKHRNEYEKTISKHRPDLVELNAVSQNVDRMFDLIDSLNVPQGKKRKYEQIMTKWLATSKMILPEDGYKLKEAVELSEKHKEDVFSYRNPNQIIEKYAGKAKEKPTDPNTVKEFAKGTVTNKKHGITEHIVEDTKEGQLAVRKVMDTHWGENSNPWCLTQKSKVDSGFREFTTRQRAELFAQEKRKEGAVVTIKKHKEPGKEGFYYEVNYENKLKRGKLTEKSWEMWEHYSDGPKSLVFQNGRLIGFKANEQYWDRMDNATDAPVIKIKEGRVTKTVELVPIGGGKVQEFVMETRTTSKDKKTVTTEYHKTKNMGEETVIAGDYKIENRVKGQTVKQTEYRPDGTKYNEKFFKNGKTVETRIFQPNGRTNSVNTHRESDLVSEPLKNGDRIQHEITMDKIDYWYGKTLINGKSTEIGFKTPRGFEVMDVMKRVDGKLRVDFKKLREIDPDIKGLPKEVVKPEGMRTIEPVKKVLDQLDMKSETQQQMSSKKTNLSRDFNNILEEVKGVGSYKTFSEGKARQLGKRKGAWKWWGSTGMEDFSGLVTYAFAGKGKRGEAHKEFFKEHLQKPFDRAYNEMHTVKQVMSNDYQSLRKAMPEVTRQLRDNVGESVYTVENAIRTHLWKKAGYDTPGMSKRDMLLLDNFVKSNKDLLEFAEGVSMITKLKEGYSKPKEYWLAETITSDLQKLADNHYRELALAEFVENREVIFGTWKGGKLVGDNMNKIEALYGTRHREHLEGMLWAMETGNLRPYGTDAITNKWMNWVNRSCGAIMFFNVKTAALQTISSLNYMNGTFNNPFRAAQAFANQQQYWKDFVKIFNSDMLLQRRSGLRINVETSELLSALDGKSNKAERALAYLLEKGFIPTKYADSFAIASGGATFYRNSIRKYKKQGMSEKEAEAKAWIDFMEITEATQQSSRPDFISAQQRSAVGRPILMFGNTPMQMFRRHKRRIQDIANNRGNKAENLMSALYYGAVQTMIFSYLSNAIFAKDEEDPEKEDFNRKKDIRFYETIIDSYMRGMGTLGAVPSALKNALLEFKTQNEKDWNADYAEVVYDLLNVSPPIGSKVRKVVSSLKEWQYNKDIIPEMGFHIDNPAISMGANLLSAGLNIPADRLLLKINNLRDASNSDYKTWQRIALLTGINRWSLGLGKRKSVEEIKEKVKKEKKVKKKNQKDKEKERKEINKLKEKYPNKTEEEIKNIIIIEEKNKQIFDLNKREQVKILEANDLNPKDYPKEADRVEAIMKLREKDESSIDSTLTAVENYVPSKEEQKSIELFKLNKKDQINILIDLGLSQRQIKKLKYEEDRVNKIIELQNKKSKKQ
jgi:hypothetical protein